MTRRKSGKDVVLPRRFEVHAVTLTRRGGLQEFADGCEYILNEVSNRGLSVLQFQFIEGHGAVLVVDTQRPTFLSIIPQSLRDAIEGGKQEDAVELDERMQQALGSFLHKARSTHLVEGSPAELRELRAHLRSIFRGDSGDVLQGLLNNLQAFLTKHEESCDEKERCSTLRFVKLAHQALSENLKEALQ